jgi:hypothetical protein
VIAGRPAVEALGWLATAAFASSYLLKDPAALRRSQAFAALLWVAYGAVIHALPVVVANLIVAGAALYSSFRRPASTTPEPWDGSSAPQALVPAADGEGPPGED